MDPVPIKRNQKPAPEELDRIDILSGESEIMDLVRKDRACILSKPCFSPERSVTENAAKDVRDIFRQALESGSPASYEALESVLFGSCGKPKESNTTNTKYKNRVEEHYLSSTSMNNKLSRYFTETFYAKLSPVREDFARGWQALIMLGHVKSHVYHVLMADMLLDLYHSYADCGREDILNLGDENEYLKLAAANYDEYINTRTVLQDVIDKAPTAKFEVLAFLSASILKMLYYFMSPSHSVCDVHFFEQAYQMSDLFAECADVEFSFKGLPVQSVVDLSYYMPIKPADDLQDQSGVFFPHYLYDLSEMIMKSSKRDHTGGMANFQHVVNSERQVLIESIDLLRDEYNHVLNEQDPERDIVRVLVRYPMLLNPKFVDMLSEQDPRCLLVMAHFLMLLISLNTNTLIPRGSIVLEFKNLESVVDKEWQDWLDVPRRVILGT